MLMPLSSAFAMAGVVMMDGMLVRSFDTTGVINVTNISCSNEEGQEWSYDLINTQVIELDENGCASAVDLDGNDVHLTFYVPMKG